jgi:tight adherence protein B
MLQSPIVIVLMLLAAAAAVSLWLDARQRRIDRHVAIAISNMRPESTPSIRRARVESRWEYLQRLANYRPGVTYLVSPPLVLLAGVVAGAAVVYANIYVGFSPRYVSFGAFVVGVLVARGLFGWQYRRFANQLFRQLPDTISMVTGSVRAGLPVNEAFRAISREMAEPTAGQFAIVCNEMALGGPPDEAIEGVYRRTGVREYGFFAVTLGVQMRSGGGLADTLQTLGDTVRERVALAARAKALAGEVIFSSRALTVAPLIVGALIYITNPMGIDLLLTDPIGRKMLTYAVISVILGTLVINWMVRRETSL